MREIYRVWKRVITAVRKKRYISKRDYEFLVDNELQLTDFEKKAFDNLLPQINEILENQNNNKSITKQSMWQKNPILRSIYKFFHRNRVQTEEKTNTENESTNIGISNSSPDKEDESKSKEETNYFLGEKYKPKKEIFAVSDFHGNIENWEFVKSKLVAEPESTAIILGDAMDREVFGPEILMEIKDLSDKGRVLYLPGNHDMFVYNWIKSPVGSKEKEIARMSLEKNCGLVTMQKMENYNKIMQEELKEGRISKPIQFEELIEWLGNQPIQRVIKENGIVYALAHAVFSTNLYNMDPNFNLQKALSLKLQGRDMDTIKEFNNVMWWREGEPKFQFTQLSNPKDALMVAGHTSQRNITCDYAGRQCKQSNCIHRLR